MKLPFAKMHGLGNDFVLLDARRVPLPGSAREMSNLARRMCDRRLGIGADGVMLLLSSHEADVAMRFFNPDGTEAQMCGNGIRCLAAFARARAVVPGPEGILVETPGGNHACRFVTYDFTSMEGVVDVDMGVPVLERSGIPVLAGGAGNAGEAVDLPLELDGATYKVTCVNMGNPHCILFLDAQKGTPLENVPLAHVPLEELGPRLESHPAFPERTNVEVASIEPDGSIRVRVWERGAGITQACGTGACATFVAARRTGRVGPKGKVHLPGGTLDVRWDNGGSARLIGAYRWVFEGEWWEESDLFAP